MQTAQKRKIILEDGTELSGYVFGDRGSKILELVFNTSMVGYQEILSDPSYTDQAVVMTYPLIGNYGMADDDYETKIPTIGAFVVREYNDIPSNFRSTHTLGEVMKEYGIAGVSGIDTRRLARIIRNTGSCKVLITAAEDEEGSDYDISPKEAAGILEKTELPHDAVSRVSRKEKEFCPGNYPAYNVVAVDCGMKQNIVRSMNRRGCNVTIVPWNATADEIIALNPDGVFLSNGPGDPEDVKETIETVRALKGRYPIFGICLGHQILSLAYGAKTYKLKFGHRGGNHPVKNLVTGKVEVTSQNHSYAVDQNSLIGTSLAATHINLLDNTVEGVRCGNESFGVQYHPESSPGPNDSAYLFDSFIRIMKMHKEKL